MNLDQCEAVFDKALSASTEAEFCYAIEPLWQHYQILSAELGRGNIFWRARIIEDEAFQNVAELDYPPASVARQGRLNDAGVPCFYVSTREETAVLEVEARVAQLVQVAGFRVLAESPVRLAMIGEYANVHKSGYWHFLGSDPDLSLTRMMNSMDRADAMRTLYIDRFFASVLSDPAARKNGYLHSRALGQSIHARLSEVDGIVFPSVRDRGGFNLAVKAEASDRCFHNVACVVTKIAAERLYGLVDLELLRSVERLDEDGNFIWRNPDENELVLGIYGLTKEEFDAASADPDDKNRLLNMTHYGRLRRPRT